MSGRLGDLSDKQQDALSQLRDRTVDLPDVYRGDVYLLRWLRARVFDVNKAEKMLRENVKWRKQMDVDSLLTSWEAPEVLKKYHPGGLCGKDKTGSPVWIEPAGHGDVRGILHSVKTTDLLKFKASHCEFIWEKFDQEAKKSGRRIDEVGLVIIFDLDKYGLRHLWKPAIGVMGEILNMFEAHYPETLKTTFIINAPKIFPFAYSIFKVFLSEDTKKKLVILGRNWREELLKYIDAEQLPVHWGGTATDPDGDPHCKSRVNMGGEVPKSYYLQREQVSDSDDFCKVTVSRAATHRVVSDVTQAGSVLRWQFWTDGGDISFGVYRCDNGKNEGQLKRKDMEEVIPMGRVNCHLVPEEGSCYCVQQGRYVLYFDNSFSWVTSKKLAYLVEVLDSNSLSQGDMQTFPSDELSERNG